MSQSIKHIESQIKQNLSPLRYPGGKRCLVPFLIQIIEKNNLYGCNYIEPYAGGAGAALELLRTGVVDRIHLNDKDPAIYSFWKYVIAENSRFLDEIENVPVTLDSWQHYKDIVVSQRSGFELAFATFFMNRTSISGIIKSSGPIGGLKQSGKYKINCRFNKAVLKAKIEYIGSLKKYIKVSRRDSLTLLKKSINSSSDFYYLDPPYYHKAKDLYLNSYAHNDHVLLRNYLMDEFYDRKWILSYDYCDEIAQLYSGHKATKIGFNYNAANKGKQVEFFSASEQIALPLNSSID